jgi:CMP-N-acetylneuraminic acid synthetase
VLTLQPTSPLRTTSTIEKFVTAFNNVADRYDAMLSLHEERTDFWQQVGESQFKRLFPDAPRRSQERDPLWAENSALYITKSSALRKTGFILGESATGYVIDAIEGVDINNPLDLLWAEFLLSQRNNK